MKEVFAAIAALLMCTISSAAANMSAADRLEAAWHDVRDYSVMIDAHEILGTRTDDRVLHYAFRKPAQSRLDLMSGNRRVASIVWNGKDDAVAYRPDFAFLKLRANVHDRRFTSLRGNGVLTPNFGEIVACLQQFRSVLRERPGPVIAGEPTAQITLPYTAGHCPTDSAADANVTLDVFDISAAGVVVLRQRYEDSKLVESWSLHDYHINAGLDDRALR